jgi:hypothetical protein
MYGAYLGEVAFGELRIPAGPGGVGPSVDMPTFLDLENRATTLVPEERTTELTPDDREGRLDLDG